MSAFAPPAPRGPRAVRRNALLVALIVAAGCGGGADAPAGGEGPAEGAASSPSGSAAAPSGPLFDRSVGDLSCELLTAELVAAVVGVPASELQGRSVLGACTQRWSDGSATLTSLRVFDDAARAARFFEDSNRQLTPEEAARAAEAIGAEMERRAGAGEVTREQVETGRPITAGAAAAATQPMEVVDGLGDRALYDGTVRTMPLPGGAGNVTTAASQVAVLLGNAVFTAEVNAWRPGGAGERESGPPPEARARNRELTLALGRALIQELGKHR